MYNSWNPLLFSGLIVAVIALLVGNIDVVNKAMVVLSGLLLSFFGWWLLRRGSNSTWDAISWLLANVIS